MINLKNQKKCAKDVLWIQASKTLFSIQMADVVFVEIMMIICLKKFMQISKEKRFKKLIEVVKKTKKENMTA